MLEDVLGHAAITNHLNHAGVVPRVRKELAAWKLGAKGEQGRVVGHVAAGKDEGRLLFVEARDLVLQDLVEYGVAPDVPRACVPLVPTP